MGIMGGMGFMGGMGGMGRTDGQDGRTDRTDGHKKYGQAFVTEGLPMNILYRCVYSMFYPCGESCTPFTSFLSDRKRDQRRVS